jgi:hypothetical protein
MAGDSPPLDSGSGSRPIPDPTELTSKAVDALRKELTDLFDTKLTAEEKLTSERFAAVTDKLNVAERLRLEQKVDTKTAVDAALAAAKEAVNQQSAAFTAETNKTERNFSEQLKGQRDTFGTAIAGQITRYDDLDKRVTRIESVKIGGQESKAGVYTAVGLGITVLLAAITIVSVLLAVKP